MSAPLPTHDYGPDRRATAAMHTKSGGFLPDWTAGQPQDQSPQLTQSDNCARAAIAGLSYAVRHVDLAQGAWQAADPGAQPGGQRAGTGRYVSSAVTIVLT